MSSPCADGVPLKDRLVRVRSVVGQQTEFLAPQVQLQPELFEWYDAQECAASLGQAEALDRPRPAHHCQLRVVEYPRPVGPGRRRHGTSSMSGKPSAWTISGERQSVVAPVLRISMRVVTLPTVTSADGG